MAYFKHVGFTWLLANIVHPFLFCLLVVACRGTSDVLTFVLPLSLIIGGLFSLPLLLVAQWLLPVIVHTRAPVGMRLMLWGLLLLGGTLLCAAFAIGVFSNWHFSCESFLFPFPALVALAIVFVVRVGAFKKMCVAAAPAFDPIEWNNLISQPSNTQTNES